MIRQLQSVRQQEVSLDQASPFLLCASDDNYAQPLTVMLHSAASNLRSGRLQVILMDGGLTENSWGALKESLHDLPVDILIVNPDRSKLRDLATSHHITHTAYFRLMAAELLPSWLDKVIYLDSDVLVKDDLGKLWDEPIEDHYCLAVPDIACPFVDARMGGDNRRKANPYMAALSPIPNWKSLGLAGSSMYFNSGVMVLNLARWRRENISTRLLRCLRENPEHVWCWDQYALNVVFSEQWGQLDYRWNQGAHVFEYPDETCSPIELKQFQSMRDEPSIIHFTTEWKPWQHRPYHPLASMYFEELDKTAYRGWRPTHPGFHWKEAWDNLAVSVCRKSVVAYRKLMGSWA